MNSPQPDSSECRFNPQHFDSFVFVGVEEEADRLKLLYRLEGEAADDVCFAEEIVFDRPCYFQSAGHRQVLHHLNELLLHVAGTSYYKSAAPPELWVQGEHVLPGRAEFLATLYREGLAEFAYTNALDLRGLRVRTGGACPATNRYQVGPSKKILLPFGGGKDSLLSLQLLQEAGFEPTLFVVGPNPVAEGLAAQTGQPLIRVRRRLDPGLAGLNADGAFNGHVPVTAIVSLIAVITAVREGFSAVVMSNESSANTGTLFDTGAHEVNHQFSKGLVCESLLRDQLAACGLDGFEYFSLLRPFSELRICQDFARRGRHFGSFVSCNKNFRRDRTDKRPSWCMACSKCLFVHLSMSPFLSAAEMMQIFGANPLDDQSHLDAYRALLEVGGGRRPFDCVGSPAESKAAFQLLSEQPEASSWAAVRKFDEEWKALLPAIDVEAELALTEEHLVPERFLGALHAAR